MRLNKILVTIVLTLSLILSMFTNVYAEEEESGTLTLTLDSSSSFKVGDEITLNLSISVTGFEGILMFYADVNYDHQALQYEGITPERGWNIVDDSDNVYLERRGIDDAQGLLCKLKFKVLKDDADTTIKIEAVDTAGTNGALNYLYGNVNEPSITLRAVAQPENPAPENPAPENPAPENPAPENPAPENPAPENPAPENPAPESPAPENPAPESPAPENPAPESPAPENPAPENPAPEKPAEKPAEKPVEKPVENKKPTVDSTTSKNKIPKTGSMAIEIIILPIAIVAIVLLIKYIKLAMEIK